MRSEAGFSMTELMAALTIGSIIVSFCYTAFLFIDKMYQDWDRRTAIVDLAQRTVRTIASDLQSAKSVTTEADTGVSIVKMYDRKIHYSFCGRRVLRDSVSFCGDTGVSMKVELRKTNTGYLIKISVLSRSQTYTAGVEAHTLESSASRFKEGKSNAVGN